MDEFIGVDMKNQMFFSGILSAFLIIFAPKCPANIVDQLFCDLHPFVGIDAQGRHMGFQEAFGGNVFKENLPQYNVYVGARFLRYFGVAIGYEETKTKSRLADLLEGDTILGILIQPGDGTQVHYSETQVRGKYFDLLGFWPICPRYCVELFGSIGIVRNTLSLQDSLTVFNNVIEEDPLIRSFSAKKTNARASIGIQKLFCQHLGIRALVAWEDTSRFNNLSSLENPTGLSRVDARSSINYGLGIFALL